MSRDRHNPDAHPHTICLPPRCPQCNQPMHVDEDGKPYCPDHTRFVLVTSPLAWSPSEEKLLVGAWWSQLHVPMLRRLERIARELGRTIGSVRSKATLMRLPPGVRRSRQR